MPKRVGRPRLDPEGNPLAKIQVLLPARQFDMLSRCADRQGISVPEAIRRVLRARRQGDRDDDET